MAGVLAASTRTPRSPPSVIPNGALQLGEFWDKARFMVNASVEKAVSPSHEHRSRDDLLVDIAKERGTAPAEVMFDVAREDELETFFRISGPVDVDESPLERILKSPATLVGISDGGAHLQTFAGGDYTSYFLEHWVREKGSFTSKKGRRADAPESPSSSVSTIAARLRRARQPTS